MAIAVSKPLERLFQGELIGTKAAIALVFLSVAVAAYLRLNVPPYRGLPLYGRDKDAWTNLQAEKLWFSHAKRVMDEGLKKVGVGKQAGIEEGPLTVCLSSKALSKSSQMANHWLSCRQPS
jgi:hypothetical protein